MVKKNFQVRMDIVVGDRCEYVGIVTVQDYATFNFVKLAYLVII